MASGVVNSPATRRTASAIDALLWYSCFSSAGLNGICVSGVVTRTIGAVRDENASSATIAEISAAALHVRCAG